MAPISKFTKLLVWSEDEEPAGEHGSHGGVMMKK
jgi:hypothetical protein